LRRRKQSTLGRTTPRIAWPKSLQQAPTARRAPVYVPNITRDQKIPAANSEAGKIGAAKRAVGIKLANSARAADPVWLALRAADCAAEAAREAEAKAKAAKVIESPQAEAWRAAMAEHLFAR
jgi:hypothetical protein